MASDPISAGVQTLVGTAQTIGGAIQEHRANKKLEKLINGYQPNKSIMDYYTKALDRYNPNAFDSTLYRQQQQTAGRGLATGFNALTDKRSLLGGISGLVQGYNDASLKAAATAENQQGQALGQLGQAAEAKTREDKYPFELKANLLGAKAAGGAQIMNAGLSNIFGGTSSASQMEMLKRMYGDGSGSSSNSSSSGWTPQYGKW